MFEETGYRVKSDELLKIGTYVNGVGISGAKQYLYYAEVSDKMRESQG